MNVGDLYTGILSLLQSHLDDPELPHPGPGWRLH